MSDSLQPHGLQHARLPCPSLAPRACSNSYPSSRWCHPTISSSVIPFSSCFQTFPASESFSNESVLHIKALFFDCMQHLQPKSALYAEYGQDLISCQSSLIVSSTLFTSNWKPSPDSSALICNLFWCLIIMFSLSILECPARRIFQQWFGNWLVDIYINI